MTQIAASEVQVGNVLCEGDGFMWRVTAISRTKCFTTFSFEPVEQTMLREQPCSLRIKSTAIMRLAAT